MRPRLPLLLLVLPSLLLAACGSRSSVGGATASSVAGSGAATSSTGTGGADGVIPQEVVFMLPISNGGAGPIAPGPGTVYEIAVINLDGSGLVQLTNDGTFKFLPHFSPDGTRILYTKYEKGSYGQPGALADVAVLDLATNTETLVTHGGGNVQGTWSPDGQRIAYLAFGSSVGASPGAIWIVDSDGSNGHSIAAAAGTAEDMMWGDLAWSSDDWLLFTAGQKISGCFKTRTDKIRPDGGSRTQVTDGGPGCTPMGFEQSGDADCGWSHDGATIYSSRGFPVTAAGAPGATERKLYAFSSDPWYPGKPEMDLSLPSEPSCIEGVPKGSPDGSRILLFRACFDPGAGPPGIYMTDTGGSYRQRITAGFGPDWNPRPKGA